MEPMPPAPAPAAKAERQRPKIIGLLVLTFVLAAAMVGAIVVHQDVFGSRAKLYFIADDVTGLAPGTAVRISGFRIGKVDTLELLPDHTVRVSLSIEAEHFGRLRADARANVVREQLRPAAIDLRAGSAPTALSAADPRIAFTRRGTLNEIADLAEQADHHPDLMLHGWNGLQVRLSTHSAGGITEADIALARKIDALAG